MTTEPAGATDDTPFKAIDAAVMSFVDGSGFARVLVSNLDRSRVRSFVRPVCAVRLTACPDEVCMPGPNQTIEL